MNKWIVLTVITVAAIGAVLWFVPEGNPNAEVVYTNADADRIIVNNITPGMEVSREFKVFGQARGGWYFEADFPVDVLAPDGRVLARTYAQAEGDWMTESFVPFISDVRINEEYTGPATLILRNNNASGLPEHNRSVSIPIIIE